MIRKEEKELAEEHFCVFQLRKQLEEEKQMISPLLTQCLPDERQELHPTSRAILVHGGAFWKHLSKHLKWLRAQDTIDEKELEACFRCFQMLVLYPPTLKLAQESELYELFHHFLDSVHLCCHALWLLWAILTMLPHDSLEKIRVVDLCILFVQQLERHKDSKKYFDTKSVLNLNMTFNALFAYLYASKSFTRIDDVMNAYCFFLELLLEVWHDGLLPVHLCYLQAASFGSPSFFQTQPDLGTLGTLLAPPTKEHDTYSFAHMMNTAAFVLSILKVLEINEPVRVRFANAMFLNHFRYHVLNLWDEMEKGSVRHLWERFFIFWKTLKPALPLQQSKDSRVQVLWKICQAPYIPMAESNTLTDPNDWMEKTRVEMAYTVQAHALADVCASSKCPKLQKESCLPLDREDEKRVQMLKNKQVRQIPCPIEGCYCMKASTVCFAFCAKCKLVRYCSKECEKQDEETHRVYCQQ